MQTKSIKALKWLMERYRVFSRDTVQGKSGEYKLSMFVSTTILLPSRISKLRVTITILLWRTF